MEIQSGEYKDNVSKRVEKNLLCFLSYTAMFSFLLLFPPKAPPSNVFGSKILPGET